MEADSPGYLTSPGYPKYYLGGRECVWSLQAAAGQTISIQLWDVSTQVLFNLFVLGTGRGRNTEYVHIFVEMKQGSCICPLSWSVHCNFTGDSKCNERGWACTPHPHQPGLILPS